MEDLFIESDHLILEKFIKFILPIEIYGKSLNVKRYSPRHHREENLYVKGLKVPDSQFPKLIHEIQKRRERTSTTPQDDHAVSSLTEGIRLLVLHLQPKHR